MRDPTALPALAVVDSFVHDTRPDREHSPLIDING
jgi:hypothetical protein